MSLNSEKEIEKIAEIAIEKVSEVLKENLPTPQKAEYIYFISKKYFGTALVLKEEAISFQ